MQNIGRSFLGHVLEEPLAGELVTVEDVEGVAVDNDVFADQEVSRGIESIGALVLVLLDFQELPFVEPRVLLALFVDAEGVVVQEEHDDEVAIHVFGLAGVETGLETELDLVVHPLEVVLLGSLGHETVYLAESVLFVAEAVVGRDDDV